ncbi:MAG: thioredoxin family protein [Verrucomicrobia bacterium]|nr:thioredoxin family protein [Verrucomicrobiota bacterium]
MMRLMWCRLLWGMLVGLLTAGTILAQGKSEVRLLVDTATVRPGSSFYAVIELVAPPEWHTYWRNPGDSGQRTKVEWTLPEGITAGDLLWPTPHRLTEADLTTYVYDGRVALPVQFQVAPSRAPGPITLQAKVSWLECKTECLPGRASVSASLAVGPESQPSPSAPLIQAALATLPTSDPNLKAEALWEAGEGDTRMLRVRSSAPGYSDFYPFEDDTRELVRKSESKSDQGILFAVTKSGDAWPKEMAGLVMLDTGTGPRGVTVNLPITDAATVAIPTAATPPGTAEPPASGANSGLWFMLGLSFLGGLILNIMPCVLPVIALKVLGFVKQSRENPGRVRFLGFVYTGGVLVSFGVLAGLVIAVQAAGQTASWGMQFQNPIFLVAITTLVTLVALNLFGVFEITLHSQAMGTASQLASKEGPTGAFFNGVFTTVLATPCTAPFLGTALGFAFGQPPMVLLLMFLVAGLGLATPYLLLSIQPAWLKFLPKPGNWMITFKVLMGFPMLATAVWLLSLSADQYGEGGVFLVGMFLVCVSLAAWVFGHFIQTGTGNPKWSWGTVVAALAGGYFVVLESQLNWRSPAPLETASTEANSDGTVMAWWVRSAPLAPGATNSTPQKLGPIPWQPWSPEAITKARAAGHPVLVDFTAKWCLTCRVNKAVAIEVPAVKEKLAAYQVVTLKGDYTREDPAIARELRMFGRAGVPLVLVYPKNLSLPPKILPSTLTEGIVLDALKWAAQ